MPTTDHDTTPTPAGHVGSTDEFGSLAADLALQTEIMQLHIQQVMQMMPLVGALLAFQEWVHRPKLPSERQLRRAHSYWREVRRSELEFKAAFPNWICS